MSCQNHPYESEYDVLQLGRIICQRKRKFCANMILCVRSPLRNSPGLLKIPVNDCVTLHMQKKKDLFQALEFVKCGKSTYLLPVMVQYKQYKHTAKFTAHSVCAGRKQGFDQSEQGSQVQCERWSERW